jgi:hypothetical protein
MEYPPGGPIRSDITRPTGVNPVGKKGKPLWFFPFSRSAVTFLVLLKLSGKPLRMEGPKAGGKYPQRGDYPEFRISDILFSV